jgi:hypothetical protein
LYADVLSVSAIRAIYLELICTYKTTYEYLY